MGFPPRSWFDVERIARGYTGVWSVLVDNMVKWDPEYFEDFWTVPGYLGANPPPSLAAGAAPAQTTVVKARSSPSEARELGLPLPMAMRRHERSTTSPVALRVGRPARRRACSGAMLRITSGGGRAATCWTSRAGSATS